MTAWSKEELQNIAKADDLHIAPFCDEGKTYGTPTWIWSVAVGESKPIAIVPAKRASGKSATLVLVCPASIWCLRIGSTPICCLY
jgi:hypothetical protein